MRHPAGGPATVAQLGEAGLTRVAIAQPAVGPAGTSDDGARGGLGTVGSVGQGGRIGLRRSTARPPPPLQWPLVGRHEELELFAATLADPRAHGFVIHGPRASARPGWPTSASRVADGAGRNVARATATEGSRSIPLGALAHLLPPEHRRRALRPGRRHGRGAAGAAATRRPAARSCCSSTTSTCSTPPRRRSWVSSSTPTSCSSWPRCGRTQTSPPGIDVAVAAGPGAPRRPRRPRPRRRWTRCCTSCCGARSRRRTITEIWTASQGNVLFVRELVLGALDGGRLVDQRGVWRLVGPLVATPRLARAGRRPARHARTRPTARRSTSLAVWEPAGLVHARGDRRAATSSRCSTGSGLLTVRTDGRRQQVTLAHPLYGEILRARMPALDAPAAAARARRSHRRARAPDAGRTRSGWPPPAWRRRDRPTRACWSGRPGWPATARTSPRSSGSAGPRCVDGMTPEAGLLVGEALHELGRFDEADEVLAAAAAAAADDDELLVPHHRDPGPEPDVGPAAATTRRSR